jgi:hypothetical protein
MSVFTSSSDRQTSIWPLLELSESAESLNVGINMIEPHCLIEAEHIAGLRQAVFVELEK